MTTGRNCTECTLDMAYCECHVTPAVTDNDKAAASEVSSSDRARDITALLREQARYLAALDINGWWNIMISAADFIESQRLALEEKDKIIANLNKSFDIAEAEIKEKDKLIKERYCLGCSTALQPNLLSHQFCQTIEQLQSRVKELEARIQHMDNACLDNFGVTITSILD